MIIFGVSIPLAFVLYGLAFVAWCLIPVGMSIGMAIDRRRHPEPSGTP